MATVTVSAEIAKENGTFVEQFYCTDEDGAVVTPNAIVYDLSDGSGEIVNSRSSASVTPSTLMTVVLSGADLAISGSSVRVMTIRATYNSTLGTSMPLNDERIFYIEKLVNVPAST